MSDELRERLAAYAHEAWAGWMRYMFEKCRPMRNTYDEPIGMLISFDLVERWQRQMNTPYADLPETEKESDRKEADEILAIVATPTMPAAVRATMREALETKRQTLARRLAHFCGELGWPNEIEMPEREKQACSELRQRLAAIDAALAWIDATNAR